MLTSTPSNRYQDQLHARNVVLDPSQQTCLEALAALAQSLEHSGIRRWWQTWHPTSLKGMYLWGGVGRGKTLLMDLFFNTLNIPDKKRMHFHDFMHTIHQAINQHAGQADPLRIIAKKWRSGCRVLCLDECTVDDVADALILGELLNTFFKSGIVLITTSNTHPNELYKNGVQRQLFLKAIEAIQAHCTVLLVDHGEDYRQRTLKHEATCLPDQALADIDALFNRLATGNIERETEIIIDERPIRTRALAHRMIWFEFDAICKTARSTPDYLTLVKQYDTFFITHVPRLSDNDVNATRRFVHLIDVLYDNHAHLVFSASVDVDRLYTGDLLRGEFLRTASRLREMMKSL